MTQKHDFNAYIGNRIRKKRKSMNMSLQQLADVLKLSMQQVQKYESGASKVTADRLVLIAHILNESIDYFYQDLDLDNIVIGEAQQSNVIQAVRHNKLNVMLVEDNPPDAILFKEAATNVDYVEDVVIEHDANKVMPYLLNQEKAPNHKKPDIIFLDLMLSSGNGFDCLKQIKQHSETNYIAVVVLSGSINREDMLKSYHMGAASYILKTGRERNLYDILPDILNYWGKIVILPNM